jgi:hypothetical protein
MGALASRLGSEEAVETSLMGDQRYFASSGRNADPYIL